KLQHYAPAIQAVRTSGSPPSIQLLESNTRPPLTFKVAYHTESDNPSTVRQWFEQVDEKAALPDLTLFLDLSLVAFRSRPVDKEQFDFLLMPARNTDIGAEEK